MSETGRTALDQARDRFLEGLSERAGELRAALASLVASPGDERVLQQVRRRLHSLYAAAQVVSQAELADDTRAVLALLDAAGEAARPVADDELHQMAALIGTLPSYATPPSEASRSDPPAQLLVAARLSRPPAPDERPVEVTETAAGFLPAPAAVALLVIDAESSVEAVRAALPQDTFEIAGSADPERAIVLMRAMAPDVVLLDAGLAADAALDLVRRLRTDPVVGLRSLLLLCADGRDVPGQAARAGADAGLAKPIDPATLRAAVEQHAALPAVERSALQGLTGGTVSDIADRVAEEIRRGIADALQVGHQERISLQESTELMAAAWSAVGRVRSHLQASSGGRVRFQDAARGGGPAALALTAPEQGGTAEDMGTPLSGRRVLVADDDPAVVWFFAGLLREAGATVLEAKNGNQALELARLRRPDVVVSDILMPGVDGFALCRELRRDLVLSETPVVLLSWKEDFLQRMRELESGATGYLRKEAGSQQILAAVVDVLRPRARLEAQLQTEGEVRGRIEGLGVLCLLEAVAKERADAHVTVRDAFNVFEVDVRGGSELSVSRTASDGSFSRGRDALQQLLGVSTGRFASVRATGPLRGAFEQPLAIVLREATRRLGALLDAVSDAQLMCVAAVEFDEELLPSLLSATPTHLMEVVAHLRSLDTAESVVLQSGMSPHELERDLRELARRGAVRGVFDADGEDLVRAALKMRQERPGTLFHSSIPPAPARSVPAPTEAPTVNPAVQAGEGRGGPVDAGAEPDAVAGPDGADSVDSEDSEDSEDGSGGAAGDMDGEAWDDGADERGRRPLRSMAATLLLLTAMGYFGLLGLVRAGLVPGGAPPEPAHPPAAAVGGPSAPSEALAVARPARSEGGTAGTATPKSARQPGAPAPKPMELGPASARPVAGGAPQVPGDTRPAVGFGRVLPFIDRGRGVSVAAGEGLLVVEDHAGASGGHGVRVGDRDLGVVPVEIALPAGRYEVVFSRGQRSSFRYLLIREGETRIVQPPSTPGADSP